MLVRIFSALVGATLATASVAADDFPKQPVTIVVPSDPGGLSDILARRVAEKAGPAMGATLIVTNRPGASGAIGSTAVKNAAPDGYTILLANGASHGALPALSKNPAYDPIKDFAPIARVGETQLALVASKRLPVKSAKELLEYARTNSGTLRYGTFGHASAGHLFGEVMKKENRISMTHVPFKGEAAVIQALIAGEIELGILVSAKTAVDGNQVTLLGITSPEGAAAYPGWPTLDSQGVKGFTQARGFQVFLAPAGTPPQIIARFAAAFSDAVRDKDTQKLLLELGVNPATEAPQDFPGLYRSLVEQWRSIVVSSGVTAE